MISLPTFYHVCKGCRIRRDRFYIYMDELYLPVEHGYNKTIDGMLIPAAYIPFISAKNSAEFLDGYTSDLVSPDIAQELTPTSNCLGNYLDDIRKVMPEHIVEFEDMYIDISHTKYLKQFRGKEFPVYSLHYKGDSETTDHYIAAHCLRDDTARFASDSPYYAKRAFTALRECTSNVITVTCNDGVHRGGYTLVDKQSSHLSKQLAEFTEKWGDALYEDSVTESAEPEPTHTQEPRENNYFIETVNEVHTGRGLSIRKDRIFKRDNSDRLYYVFFFGNPSLTRTGFIDIELANSDQAELLRDYNTLMREYSDFVSTDTLGFSELDPSDPDISKYYRALNSISLNNHIDFTYCYISTTAATRLCLNSGKRKTYCWVFPIRRFDNNLLGYVSVPLCYQAVAKSGNIQRMAIAKMRGAVYGELREASGLSVVLSSGIRDFAEFTAYESSSLLPDTLSIPTPEWVTKWTDVVLEAFVSEDADEGIKEAEAEEPTTVTVPETSNRYECISAADSSIQKLYEHLVPRLDSIGYTLDEIKAANKWNNGKLDELVKKLEVAVERLSTDAERRGVENQLAFEELARDQIEIRTYAIDTKDAVTQLHSELDEIRGSIRELILKEDEDNKTIISFFANTKGSVESVRIDIQGIIDVFQKTLNALDKESAESKDRQLHIQYDVRALMGAVYSVVEYQERILQNQERKGFWNRLKSLFKK